MIVHKDESYVLVREIGDGNFYFAHWKEGATCVDGSYVEGVVEDASRFDTAKAAWNELVSSGQQSEGWTVRSLRTVYHLGGIKKWGKR